MKLLSTYGQPTYLVDLGIAHQLFHGILRVEPVAAEDLHGVGGVLVSHVAGVGLGDRRHVRVAHSLGNHLGKKPFTPV